jgi:hypothetical protein
MADIVEPFERASLWDLHTHATHTSNVRALYRITETRIQG